jgi:hypothetical protein
MTSPSVWRANNLFDPLFDIFERRISLWEAELNAPGNEIAYIIKTRDAFS